MNRGSGPSPAKIMVVGEYYSQDDYHTQEPFSGEVGKEFNRMLHEAGIMRSECYLTNAVNARPPNGQIAKWLPKKKMDVVYNYHQFVRGKWVAPEIITGIEQLHREVREVKPNIIVAAGNLALWALSSAEGAMKWRGSLLRADQLPRNDQPLLIPIITPTAIFAQWENRAITVLDLKRVAKHRDSREMPANTWRFTLRPSYAAVLDTLNSLLERAESESFWLDFDLETRAGHIACAGLSWSRDDAICIPLMCVEDREGFWGPDAEAEIVYLLYKILTHPAVKVRGQNLLYDAQYTYRHWHFVPRVVQDTMISQHTLFAGLRKSLDFQASMYSPEYVYWKDDGKTWTKDVGEDQLWAYNCVDCVRTREVGEAELAAIPAMGLQEVEDFQQSMFWPVLQAMQRGVRIDKEERKWMDKKMETELAKRLSYFEFVLGHKLNVNSNPQMKKLFYEDFNLKPIMSRAKKGEMPHVTCDDSALATIALKNPILRPLIRAIQEYRTIRVFLSTFIRMPLDIDDRMRTSYNICGTETYRLSSSENAFDSGGNLQNVPKGGEDDESDLVLPNMRTIFVPDPGFTFFDTDLSKADLRVVIWESDETEMKAMLAEGRDPYIETAREFYNDPTITKRLPNGQDNPKYKIFKSFAHGTHYLGTAVGLSQRLGLTVHQAERTQKWYFGKYPKIKDWQEVFCDEIRRTRRVKNAFGYTRVYFDRISESTCREAIAWLPQSTVACVINRVWKNLFDHAPQIQVLLQVHDSLAGQFPTHRTAECHEDFARLSRIVVPYPDPLIIPIELKTSEKSWGDC